jgi:hypothetical protein
MSGAFSRSAVRQEQFFFNAKLKTMVHASFPGDFTIDSSRLLPKLDKRSFPFATRLFLQLFEQRSHSCAQYMFSGSDRYCICALDQLR